MNDQEPLLFTDHRGRIIRLTKERSNHILEHPEMVDQVNRIEETLAAPELVIVTTMDETVWVYHRLYPKTPVTRKYLLVAVKMIDGDAFVLTAFFSGRQKRGEIIWQA